MTSRNAFLLVTLLLTITRCAVAEESSPAAIGRREKGVSNLFRVRGASE